MAKVTKDGRVVLYTIRGKPVYADDTQDYVNQAGFTSSQSKGIDWQGRGFDDHNLDLDDDHGHHGVHKGDRKPHEHDEHARDPKGGKGSGKFASYKLVRGKDGTLNVQYVDTQSGKVLTNKDLPNYKIVTARNDLTDIYPKGTPQNPDKPDTPETPKGKDSVVRDKNKLDGGFTDHSRGAEGHSPGSRSKSAPSGSTANPNTVEQGDFGWADPLSKENKTLAGEKEKGWTDTPIGAPDDQHPAYSTDLDTFGQGIVPGTMKSPYEGQDLGTVSVTGQPTPSYSDDEKKDLAQTIAGEMSAQHIDPNNPDDMAEAAAIASTAVNRDEKTPGGLSDALHEPSQYSAWNNDESAKIAKDNYAKNPAAYDGFVDKFFSDPSFRGPYTNYYNPDIANPGWSTGLTDKQKIGDHLFGVDPSKAVGTHPLTDDQKEQIERDNINTSFTNSPAYAESPGLAGTPPDIGGPLGTNLGNFPDAYSAQKNYTGPTGPTNTPTGFADAYGAQKDYTGPDTSGFDTGRFGPPGVDTTGFDSGRFGPAPGDTTDFDNGRFAGPTSPSLSDTSRFGPSITPSSTGVYGDPTGGFGTHVMTDPNAVADSGAVAAANESQVNNSNFASGYATQKDYSADTSSTPSDTSSSTGAPSSNVSNTTGSNEGVSQGPTSTGFAGTSSDVTSSSEGTDHSSDTGSSTPGGMVGGGGGGPTSTDSGTNTSTGTTGTTGTTNDTSSDVDTGGFSDGFL